VGSKLTNHIPKEITTIIKLTTEISPHLSLGYFLSITFLIYYYAAKYPKEAHKN
jgi:hypothetical protein